jgi:hypothetical protein
MGFFDELWARFMVGKTITDNERAELEAGVREQVVLAYRPVVGLNFALKPSDHYPKQSWLPDGLMKILNALSGPPNHYPDLSDDEKSRLDVETYGKTYSEGQGLVAEAIVARQYGPAKKKKKSPPATS